MLQEKKIDIRKTCDYGQPGGYSIRVLSGRATFQLRYSWPWAVTSCALLAAVAWNGLEHSHGKVKLIEWVWEIAKNYNRRRPIKIRSLGAPSLLFRVILW